MKTQLKTLFFILSVVIICQCEKEKENQPPICNIISPSNNTTFKKGENISISVDASDPDGIIKEVHFFIDDIGVSNIQASPYNYNWNTQDIETGSHAIKAIAKDNEDIETADSINIIIDAEMPTVTTRDITAITEISAIVGGNVTDNGGEIVTSRGVCWSTSQSPTTSNNIKQVDGGTGSFSTPINDLQPNTTYYVRAYATNSVGTAYGNENIFTTLIDPDATWTPGDNWFDSMNKQYYSTVQIGDQTWMAENLKSTYYTDGTPIPLVTDSATWSNLTTPGYCWYDNDSVTYADPYGALYNWYTVNTGNLCPTDWHVPTDTEWTTLADYLGGENVAGGKLKETGTTHWVSPNEGATNESGFSALPGGSRIYSGIGYYGFWWSATEAYADKAVSRELDFDYSYFFEFNDPMKAGFSVRCIKD